MKKKDQDKMPNIWNGKDAKGRKQKFGKSRFSHLNCNSQPAFRVNWPKNAFEIFQIAPVSVTRFFDNLFSRIFAKKTLMDSIH